MMDFLHCHFEINYIKWDRILQYINNSRANVIENSQRRGDFIISTDKSLLDIKLIHNFLSTKSYWAQGRSYEIVKRSIEESLCFGVYIDVKQKQQLHLEQVGFARVVTDYSTFAWLCDVFIIESHRGQGIGKWLLEYITCNYPDLQGLQRFVLVTRDAHNLYKQFEFENLANHDWWMVHNNNI
jgi:GNAT superfamily N-acetyltransferase